MVTVFGSHVHTYIYVTASPYYNTCIIILYIQQSVKLQPMPYRGQKPQDIGCEQVITWKHVQYMYYVHACHTLTNDVHAICT